MLGFGALKMNCHWFISRGADALEHELEQHIDEPAALLTISESEKFFSNGIDPDGKYSAALGLPEPSDLDKLEGAVLGMPGFIRPLQLPIPTVAAVNGHAFGAGMMFAVAHDYRLQRADRGYMCAIEVAIGVGIRAYPLARETNSNSSPTVRPTGRLAAGWLAGWLAG